MRFKDRFDIPKLPSILTESFVSDLIERGAIPKSQLIDNIWYYGRFRRSSIAKWDSQIQKFRYISIGFQSYWDVCNHFEDDDSYALFIPIRIALDSEVNQELNTLK